MLHLHINLILRSYTKCVYRVIHCWLHWIICCCNLKNFPAPILNFFFENSSGKKILPCLPKSIASDSLRQCSNQWENDRATQLSIVKNRSLNSHPWWQRCHTPFRWRNIFRIPSHYTSMYRFCHWKYTRPNPILRLIRWISQLQRNLDRQQASWSCLSI